MERKHKKIAGFDVGGAHLKFTLVEDGKVVHAETFATPLWLGMDTLTKAFAEAAPKCTDCDLAVFTMTGELADVFSSRADGVKALVGHIREGIPVAQKQIYAGQSRFVGLHDAELLPTDVASANWHASASLVAKLKGNALFVDMGSTTTDIIAVKDGAVANRGYTDAGRLATGELVYTGFTRTFLFGVASTALVKGDFTPLMNEYFASAADVHRIMGVLDEADDRHDTADHKEKTVAASIARLARMVGRDADELSGREWLEVARWFSEQQLRMVHDAALRVASVLEDGLPVVGAGTGRWQIRRLAARLERPYIDYADVLPAFDEARNDAANGGAATAIALLADG
jgi:probable H4MPT-linked C1 transfer pathway protein